MTKPRLTPDDWIRAGLFALAHDGPSAIRAEVLARKLSTTKGSFYWHFKDVPAFQQAMLDTWSARGATSIIDALAHLPDPVQRMRAIGEAASQNTPEPYGGVRLEPAIRAWSLSDATAAAAVARVDTIRLNYLAELLTSRGITNPEFPQIIYAGYLGLSDLGARTDGPKADVASALATLIDLILILDDND